MNDKDTHSVFCLLYAMVLIDNRVVKVEVDLFFARIEGFLKENKFVEALRAKTIISDWFVQNYKDILKEMKSPSRELYMLAHVEHLKLYSHRQDVFDMLKEIAMVDNEYHDDERKFLEKVELIWNLEENN